MGFVQEAKTPWKACACGRPGKHMSEQPCAGACGYGMLRLDA